MTEALSTIPETEIVVMPVGSPRGHAAVERRTTRADSDLDVVFHPSTLHDPAVVELPVGLKQTMSEFVEPMDRAQLASSISFLIKLMKALHHTGTATHRTERLLARASAALGLRGDFFVLPTMLSASFSDPHDVTVSFSHSFRASGGLDCDRLGSCDDLARKVCDGTISLVAADAELEAIMLRGNYWGPGATVLAFGVSSASVSLLFFAGGWLEAAFSLLFGLLVGMMTWFASQRAHLTPILEFGCAIVVAFLSRIVAGSLESTCFLPMCMGSLVWFFPGLALTLAVSETAAQSLVSGATRCFAAAITAVELGFGLALGDKIAQSFVAATAETCTPVLANNLVAHIFVLPITVTAFHVLLGANLRQWLPMSISAISGYLVAYFATDRLTNDGATMMAAFSVGLIGSLFARVNRHQPLVYVLSGILMLVPGSMGVRGASAFFNNDVISGVTFGFNMLVVGLGITIGLLVSRVLIFPNTKVLQPHDTLV